jgi:membrane protease YdiL (CAAX protease family)
LPAVIEEIAFRGLVQHWLHAAISPFRAMVLASALFTALHFSVLSAPYLFALGMVLGWAKWKTGSLYPSMLIHLVHNLVVLEFFGRW